MDFNIVNKIIYTAAAPKFFLLSALVIMLGQVVPVPAAKSIRCVSEIFRRVPFDDSLDFCRLIAF